MLSKMASKIVRFREFVYMKNLICHLDGVVLNIFLINYCCLINQTIVISKEKTCLFSEIYQL